MMNIVEYFDGTLRCRPVPNNCHASTVLGQVISVPPISKLVEDNVWLNGVEVFMMNKHTEEMAS
jgi:hypothetical protein